MASVRALIEHAEVRRKSQNDITIADLTGVAVQDIAIAELAVHRLQSGGVS